MLNISRSINSALSGFRSQLFSLLAPDLSVSNIDQYLNSAFQLAYFICPDKDIASSVTAAALSQINSSLASQHKRRCYSPTGLLRSDGHSKLKLRTKVLMTRLQLFQSLIYTQSRPFEIKQEQACSTASLDEEDLIIRFIKHLVAITASRNSFYVTVGIGRLLHSYTTAEAMSIYNVVIQDPDRIKDDAYYRFCKSEMMRELMKRFGNYINKIRCARGEERFESDRKERQPVELVRRCLKMFTPWDTSCVVPENFDPNEDELSALAFKGENPDQEHPIEMRRMHSIIHPGCYSRITGALRYGEPDERLSAPRFNLAEGRSNGMRKRSDRFNPPELSEERKKSILEEVAEQEARRKRVRPRELKIMVDWEEVAILELSGKSSVRFEVDKWAGMIKVCAEDEKGELVIGIYRLEWYEEVEEGLIEEGEMELEGGERLKLVLMMRRGRYGEYDGAEVEIGSGESKAVEEAREYLREVREGREAIKRKGKEEKEVSYSRLHRRYAFGEMSIDAIADNLFFTGTSSLLEFGGEMHHLPKQGELYYHLIDLALIKGFSKAQLCEMGNKLIAMAEHALDMRQTEAAERISEVLINAPLPREYEQIGQYYQAMCVRRRGDYIASRAMLERIAGASVVPLKYRARALQTIAANYHDSGDSRESLRFHLEAGHAASPRHGCDLFASTTSQWMVAVIKSIEGDHRGALADFESLFPFVRMLAMERPFYLYSYRNSLALELAEAGRIEEAQNNCRIILSSSLAPLNPEWSETTQEVAQKARRASPSFVAISSAPSEAAHFDAADNPDETSKATGSDRLPPELCDLTDAQRLYQLKVIGRALCISDEMIDRMMKSTGVADIDSQCCGHTHHHEPQQIDIESESDLEFLIRLWSNEEIDPALFAATYMALDACKDRFRCDQIVDRIARLAFLESPECSQLQKEWLSKVENLVDLQSLDDLEEKVRLWFNNEGMQAEIAAVILSWHMCKDDALRSETSRRLIRFAFLASPDSEDMSEDEWREKVKAMVKPIADLPS